MINVKVKDQRNTEELTEMLDVEEALDEIAEASSMGHASDAVSF